MPRNDIPLGLFGRMSGSSNIFLYDSVGAVAPSSSTFFAVITTVFRVMATGRSSVVSERFLIWQSRFTYPFPINDTLEAVGSSI